MHIYIYMYIYIHTYKYVYICYRRTVVLFGALHLHAVNVPVLE